MQRLEQTELAQLKFLCNQMRKIAFKAMRNARKMNSEAFNESGFKSKRDYMIAIFDYCENEINKLTNEFIKKYPKYVNKGRLIN